jgi:site-specific DNA-methyltransferase (adenine-specific)
MRPSTPIDDAENARDLLRFRYVSKASRSERNAGCEGMEERQSSKMGDGLVSCVGHPNPNATGHTASEDRRAANHHPTVKPLTLMRWLVKLVAQPSDVVLDPFMGSGTTGVACAAEGREFIGIEREQEYITIAERRIEAASAQERLPI